MVEIGGKMSECRCGMLLKLLPVDVVSGGSIVVVGLGFQTGAMGHLLPKRLLVGALVQLMGAV